MTEIFGIPTQALFGQLLIGLINGSFYALLSLGLAVIFGLLNIINFTHGAQYMMGAFCAYFLLTKLGVGYWWALAIAPIAVGIIGMVIERLMLARLYKLDHLYGLLLTFGLALIIQGLFRNEYGTSGIPYAMPQELSGGRNLGFMFLPNYRAWVILASMVVCLATWFVIEKTRLGAYLRAATENPQLVQAFGINVPRMITLTYGFGLAPLVAYPVFLMKVMCFALFACAFNLLIGYGGLLSFGHAMFLGTAGYASAHAAKVWGFPPEFAILFGTACSALLGLVTGLLAIRRQGIYFAMITLALAQMVYFFYLQAPFTGGEDGIQSVPRGKLFGLVDLKNVWAMYSLVFAVFVGGFLLIHRTVHSPFGQVLKAIRENEPRALSLGYDVGRYKLLAYVLSATLAGLAGATKVLVFELASLTDVHWTMSGEVVLMTLLGGLGTVFGPVVGALIIISMENYLAQLGSWVTVTQGVIFVICVLTFRRGVVGELGRLIGKPL